MKDELFRGVRPPRPSPLLRARVLAAAEAELSRPRWGQGFGFNRWDLAWVAAIVVLVVVNASLAVGDRPQVTAARPPADPAVVALAAELGLPSSALQVAPEPLTPAQAHELEQLLNERI
ncbi:MAG: hypothetical protein AB2L07_10180 [Thermoanaerobaculaceae bacterium]